MTTTFSDFLRERAARYESQQGDARDVLEEWRAAVDRLFTQLCGWLKEADPTGIIAVERGQEKVREQGLGHYEVPRLDLRAFGKWVGLIPKARRTVGTAHPPQKKVPERADGRVDITDELRRYVLYRFLEDGQDVWVIDDLHSGQQPLTREAFEKALMSYWQ
jgi:hypothetical protein